MLKMKQMKLNYGRAASQVPRARPVVPVHAQAASFHICQARQAQAEAGPGELQGVQAFDGQASRSVLRSSRRGALLALLAPAAMQLAAAVSPGPVAASVAYVAAVVKPELQPDQSKFDPADPDLRAAANLLQEGLNAADVVTEEKIWTQIIDTYGGMDKPWVPDVVGRAWGNRGNARSRQGKLVEAVSDYNESIRICPWSVDPVLNRGVAFEALGQFEDAIRDYKTVLAAAPDDPAAWNNLGNATAGLGQWQDAAGYYKKAVMIAGPGFSFAAANYALCLYQLGQTDEAIREMRGLLRKYPNFTDVRASLSAALWGQGLEGQAETNWARVDDSRYKDRQWLKESRRWPPRLVADAEALLDLKSK